MSATDYIFNCPEDTEFDTMDAQAQDIIKSLNSEWPSFPMVGTRSVGNRKLLHVRMDSLLIKQYLDSLFMHFNLDWDVLSIRSAYKEGDDYIVEYIADKYIFIIYMNPKYNEETGEYIPVTLDDVIYLSTYAGTDPIQL